MRNVLAVLTLSDRIFVESGALARSSTFFSAPFFSLAEPAACRVRGLPRGGDGERDDMPPSLPSLSSSSLEDATLRCLLICSNYFRRAVAARRPRTLCQTTVSILCTISVS